MANIGHSLRRALTCYDRIFEERAGVTPAQFALLHALMPGTQRLSALVGVAAVDKSTLYEVAVRLAEQGLIVRKRSDIDGRAFDVSLTAQGRRAAQRACQHAIASEVEFLAPISATDRDKLKILLEAAC